MKGSQTPYHLQRPDDFDTDISGPDLQIHYDRAAELTQGGPVIGNILINGFHLAGSYGGPAYIADDHVYLPMLEKKLFGSYFRLVRIHSKSLSIEIIGELHRLIWIEKIQDGKVWFYDSVDQSKLLSISISSQ